MTGLLTDDGIPLWQKAEAVEKKGGYCKGLYKSRP